MGLFKLLKRNKKLNVEKIIHELEKKSEQKFMFINNESIAHSLKPVVFYFVSSNQAEAEALMAELLESGFTKANCWKAPFSREYTVYGTSSELELNPSLLTQTLKAYSDIGFKHNSRLEDWDISVDALDIAYFIEEQYEYPDPFPEQMITVRIKGSPSKEEKIHYQKRIDQNSGGVLISLVLVIAAICKKTRAIRYDISITKPQKINDIISGLEEEFMDIYPRLTIEKRYMPKPTN